MNFSFDVISKVIFIMLARTNEHSHLTFFRLLDALGMRHRYCVSLMLFTIKVLIVHKIIGQDARLLELTVQV